MSNGAALFFFFLSYCEISDEIDRLVVYLLWVVFNDSSKQVDIFN